MAQLIETGQTTTRASKPAPPLRSQRRLTWWGDVWQRFSRQRVPLIAGAVLLVLALLALLAPLIAPYDPNQQFSDVGLTALGEPLAPNGQFWLGTDGLGRDVLSRLLFGERTSLFIGLAGAGGAIA